MEAVAPLQGTGRQHAGKGLGQMCGQVRRIMTTSSQQPQPAGVILCTLRRPPVASCWALIMTAHHNTCMHAQVLVYFAVAKKGEKPTDGKTDVNPEGLTAGKCGKVWEGMHDVVVW